MLSPIMITSVSFKRVLTVHLKGRVRNAVRQISRPPRPPPDFPRFPQISPDFPRPSSGDPWGHHWARMTPERLQRGSNAERQQRDTREAAKRQQDGVMLGSFWGHLGVISGSFWGSSWDHFGVILGSFWDHFGVILGSFWEYFLGGSLG